MKKRLTVEVSATIHKKLADMVSLKAETVEQYCVSAILDALSRDETNGVAKRPTLAESADRFEELRKRFYGGEVMPGDSAEDIRQAREERSAQLEGRS